VSRCGEASCLTLLSQVDRILSRPRVHWEKPPPNSCSGSRATTLSGKEYTGRAQGKGLSCLDGAWPACRRLTSAARTFAMVA
jgi:hypothetical protein